MSEPELPLKRTLLLVGNKEFGGVDATTSQHVVYWGYRRIEVSDQESALLRVIPVRVVGEHERKEEYLSTADANELLLGVRPATDQKDGKERHSSIAVRLRKKLEDGTDGAVTLPHAKRGRGYVLEVLLPDRANEEPPPPQSATHGPIVADFSAYKVSISLPALEPDGGLSLAHFQFNEHRVRVARTAMEEAVSRCPPTSTGARQWIQDLVRSKQGDAQVSVFDIDGLVVEHVKQVPNRPFRSYILGVDLVAVCSDMSAPRTVREFRWIDQLHQAVLIPTTLDPRTTYLRLNVALWTYLGTPPWFVVLELHKECDLILKEVEFVEVVRRLRRARWVLGPVVELNMLKMVTAR